MFAVQRIRAQIVAVLLGCVCACGDGGSQAEQSDSGTENDSGAGLGDAATAMPKEARVRGRVTGLDGKPLEGVAVSADGQKATTDAKGRFELAVAADAEVRVSVESDKYSGASVPVIA